MVLETIFGVGSLHSTAACLYRDGCVDEEGGEHGRGVDGGREEPTIGSLQERDRRSESIVEDNQQY